MNNTAYEFRTHDIGDNIEILDPKKVHSVEITYPPDERSTKILDDLSKYKSFIHEVNITCNLPLESAYEVYSSILTHCEIQFLSIRYIDNAIRTCVGIEKFISKIKSLHISVPEISQEDLSICENFHDSKTKLNIRLTSADSTHSFGSIETNMDDIVYLDENESVAYLNNNVLSHPYHLNMNNTNNLQPKTSDDSDVRMILVSDYDTIDLSVFYTDSDYEINIDVDKVYKFIKVIGIPKSISKLKFGYNLSHSISSCIDMSQSLVSYKGPFLNEMSFSSLMEDMTIVYTKYSLPSCKIVIPPNVVILTVVTFQKITDVDDLFLPKNLQYLNFEGILNVSIDNLSIPDSLVNMNTSQYMLNPIVKSDHVTCDLTNNNKVVLKTTDNIINMLRNSLPLTSCIPYLHINGNGSLCDIWTDILLEGNIKTGNLLIDADNSIFKDIYKVFERSWKLDNPVSLYNIIIRGVSYDKSLDYSLLNLALSMKKTHNLNLIIYFENNFNKDLIPMMGRNLGMKFVKTDDGFRPEYLWGAIKSYLDVSNIDGKSLLTISKGDGPINFMKMKKDSSVLVASALIVPEIETQKTTVHLWTSCGYCTKQKEIIEKVRQQNDDFDRKVIVNTVTDPNSIEDKRIRSFPSWVVDDIVQPGVKNEKEILKLL